MYIIVNENVIKRISDNACIPVNEGNRDYQEYLMWVAEGNVAQTADSLISLDDCKLTKRKIINSNRNEELNKSSATVSASGFEWSIDPMSIQELNNVLTTVSIVGDSYLDGIVWRDFNNIDHTATLTLLVSISQAISTRRKQIWEYSWQLKTQIENATTKEEVNSILWEFPQN